MDRLVRALLAVVPADVAEGARSANVDLEGLVRFRPLAELLRLARESKGWSVAEAARWTGVPEERLSQWESAELELVEGSVLLAHAVRLGMGHLLGEWVTANPGLAVRLGLPDEPGVLSEARRLLMEDTRLGSLVPALLTRGMPVRFEAPLGFAEAMDPEYVVEHFQSQVTDFDDEEAGEIEEEEEEEEVPVSPGILVTPATEEADAFFAGLGDPGPLPGPGILFRIRRPQPVRAGAGRLVYRIKVMLRDVRPAIWRRFEVPGDLTFWRLHQVVQRTMGWSRRGAHLFRHGRIKIGVPDPEWPYTAVDGQSVRLADTNLGAKGKLTYMCERELGIRWHHRLVIEDVRELGATERSGRMPICLDGERACPPDDCGGPAGYAFLQEALADPEHPEHRRMRELVGVDFEPEFFEVESANMALRRLMRTWQRGKQG